MEFNEELRLLVDEYDRSPDAYPATARLGLFLSEHAHTAEQSMEFLRQADSLARSKAERVAVLDRLGQLTTILRPRAEACAVYREIHQMFPDNLKTAEVYAGHLDWNSEPKEAVQVMGRVMALSLRKALKTAEAEGRPPRQLIEAPELLAAFGEISDTFDTYVKGRRLGLLPEVEAIVPLGGGGKVANRFLLDCWRRAVPEITWVDDEAESRRLSDAYRQQQMSPYWFPMGRDILYRHDALVRYQGLWDEQGRPPVPSLPDEVVERGRAWLHSLGLPADVWFVTLHIRDGGDRPLVGDSLNRGRNGDLHTALPAIRRIVDAGGWVIRIGNGGAQYLPGGPGVVDLTRTERRDWQDIFLLSRCRFMMGNYSGPNTVSNAFSVPTVCFDVFPFKHLMGWRGRDIVIHKLLRRVADGRLLSFDEAHSPEALRLFHPTELRDRGLALVANTAEEIDAAVAQMLRRLDGAPDPDCALNAAYDAIRRRHGLENGAMIGRHFLEAHADLFESGL